ncbi:reelin-like [Corticium candelabrum]|uniref:reelin-like n=1 Tax=Corticium candelabrum TaxID=121492 RepID=UPI002E25ADF9|nr:reelin-like [Corticium candelabrum]
MTAALLVLAFALLAASTHTGVAALGHCSSYGVYLNDDFDSSAVLNTNFWSSSSSGVLVQKACTNISSNAILSGNVLVFGATADTSRQLTSKRLNLKNAEAITFDAAACPYPATTATITATLSYSTDGGNTYQAARYFTVRKNGPGVHVVVSVTLAMKLSASVYLRVEQNSSFGGQGSQAWSIDNFAVLGQGPQEIDENFDNLTACHLLSQSSDDVKPYCSSSGNALVFSGQASSSVGHYVTSIPLFIPHTGNAPGTPTGVAFKEDFEPIPAIPGTKWADISGGRISIPECGAIDSTGVGYAAYFNDSGNRFIQTQKLDLTLAKSLSFNVRIGGLSGCENADNGEDVVVEYQVQGSSTFVLLRTLVYSDYRTAKTVNVNLPTSAQTKATTLRWRQLSNSGSGFDEWAIDHILVANLVFISRVIFSENFDTTPTIGNHILLAGNEALVIIYLDFSGSKWASISGGTFATPDCGSIGLSGTSTRAAFFQNSGTRSIQTQPLNLIDALTLSFRVRIGGSTGSTCETADSNEDVVVEYQSGSTAFTRLRLLAYDGYLTATNVTINLPAAAQKAATTLRWRQLTNSGSNLDEWAIDDIQILRTDVGTTPTAVPTTPTLATIFLENFDTTPTVPGAKWQAIQGGTFTTPDCGSIDPGFSSNAAFFSQSGTRYIQSAALDLSNSV